MSIKMFFYIILHFMTSTSRPQQVVIRAPLMTWSSRVLVLVAAVTMKMSVHHHSNRAAVMIWSHLCMCRPLNKQQPHKLLMQTKLTVRNVLVTMRTACMDLVITARLRSSSLPRAQRKDLVSNSVCFISKVVENLFKS